MAHSTLDIIPNSPIKCKNLQQAMLMLPACFQISLVGKVISLNVSETGIRGEFSAITMSEIIVDFEYSDIDSGRLVKLTKALSELQISGEGLHITAGFYLAQNDRLYLADPHLLKLGSPFSAIANYFTIFDDYMSVLDINKAKNKCITIAQISNYLLDVGKNSLYGNLLLFNGGIAFQRKFHINSSAVNIKSIFFPILRNIQGQSQSLLLFSDSLELRQDINLSEIEVYSVSNSFESLCNYFNFGKIHEALDIFPKKINFKDGMV